MVVDPDESPEAFHAALEAAAWRIVRRGQISDAGQLVLASIASAVGAALPEALREVQTAAAVRALVVLAQTEWSAAANAMAALFLAGQNKLVAANLLAGGNVVALSERTP